MCLTLLLGTRAAPGDELEEAARWVPSAAFSFDVIGQRASGSLRSSEIFGPPLSTGGCEIPNRPPTGELCRQPSRSTQPLTESHQANDTTTSALVGLSLELMTPRLTPSLWQPRLFAHAGGSLVFNFARKLAGTDDPGVLGLPPNPNNNAPTNINEETITGQGSRSLSEVQNGIFSAGAGVAFAFKVGSRLIRVKPSFEYLMQRVEFTGLANRAVQLRGNNRFRPDSLDDFRLISFSASKTTVHHGIGGGLELEVDTHRLGPLVASVFLGGRVYHLLGDLDETLSSNRNEVGDTYVDPMGQRPERVTWNFEPDNLAWRSGVGLRFRYLPK